MLKQAVPVQLTGTLPAFMSTITSLVEMELESNKVHFLYKPYWIPFIFVFGTSSCHGECWPHAHELIQHVFFTHPS